MNSIPTTTDQKLKSGALIFLMVIAVSFNSVAQQNRATKINIGLIYPISSNGSHALLDTNNVSINLIAGVSAEEKGVSFAGFSNVVRNNTHGTQFAGFSNHIGKKATGVLFAGFANTYHENEGAAFAGFSNVAHGNVKGAQFAGFANIAKEVKGAQFAGFINVSTKLDGSAFAGFMNITTAVSASQFAGFLNKANQVKGVQFAGFINVADDVSASQAAGFINKARDVNGSQLAGFINIARKVKGAQIAGFINIADSSDYPIGLLNLVKNGEKSIGISMDENQTSMLTFRSGGKILYGILAAGYNFKNKDEVYAFEAGFGAHFLSSKAFRLNVELTATTLESFKEGEYFKASFKLLPALKIVENIELFGGPSFNFTTTNTIEGKALRQKYITSWENPWFDHFEAISIGYGGGIHFIF